MSLYCGNATVTPLQTANVNKYTYIYVNMLVCAEKQICNIRNAFNSAWKCVQSHAFDEGEIYLFTCAYTLNNIHTHMQT